MRVYISLWLIYSLCVLPPFFHMEDIRTNYLLSKKSSRIADLFQNNYHLFGHIEINVSFTAHIHFSYKKVPSGSASVFPEQEHKGLRPLVFLI